jgi:hypothetical protein
LYEGTVTGGGTNGTLVSENTGLQPVEVGPLNATDNDVSSDIKLAVRCESGYLCDDCVVTPTGTKSAKWALAPDNSGSPGTYGAYGAALSVGSVPDTNVLIWAKAKATSDESPQNDTTVDLVITATIEAE